MNDYRINDFGAIGDGKTMNTEAIQKAIDACHKEGGGRVVCGRGTYRTGSIVLKSNVELYLEQGCKIVGSDNLTDYKELEGTGFDIGKIEVKKEIMRHALLIGVDAENIRITGYGEINGSGLSFYRDAPADPKTGKFDKPETPRPRMVMFYRCRNVLFEGVSFVDSPCWTFWLMKCEDVNIHRIKIYGDRKMRNVDGIDIDACCNVTVSDCIMDTEDDCISVRSMQELYSTSSVCENITVTNCVLNTSCQGIRIGCPGDGEIKNCVFNNIVINGRNGIIIQHPKEYFLREGSTGNADIHHIMFSNITIDCNIMPIWLYVEEGIKLKRISDITFSNIRVSRSSYPLTIEGSTETIIRNITFNNIEIESSAENTIICRNCENIRFDNVKINNKF